MIITGTYFSNIIKLSYIKYIDLKDTIYKTYYILKVFTRISICTSLKICQKVLIQFKFNHMIYKSKLNYKKNQIYYRIFRFLSKLNILKLKSLST